MNCSALAHQSRARGNQQRHCEQTENSFPVQGNDLSQSSARSKTGKRIRLFPQQRGSQ